jgi:LAS superfamily LD-carboxypeptidase LdcB
MRSPQNDLLAPVTLTYGLSRDYAPEDLVPLADELPMHVTMGYPSQIREVAFWPLVQMIREMQDEGLQPQVLSAYRSYAAQAFAWDKWSKLYPERAAIISAPPGYSEHQLGTVVDFGSPELASIVGQADIEFHTYFYKTSEGIWLDNNAHRYGFTLSFPAEASEVSGFYYEPWHFRYVGTEMATFLHDLDSSLTKFQLAKQPEPCLP